MEAQEWDFLACIFDETCVWVLEVAQDVPSG